MTSSMQWLELYRELLGRSKTFRSGRNGAVSKLNHLAFKPGKDMHERHLRYGKGVPESIGRRRGGAAKLVGRVLLNNGKDED